MSYLLFAGSIAFRKTASKIVGPFADLMGKVYNLLFELLHSNTSAGSLGLQLLFYFNRETDPVSSDGEAAEVFF